MITPSVVGTALRRAMPDDGELNVLVVARDAELRACLAGLLLDDGSHVTATGVFGAVELLLDARLPYDAVVVVQSSEESTLFGVPQLIRSFEPDVPILVLDDGSALPGVVELVRGAALRWPLRERAERTLH